MACASALGAIRLIANKNCLPSSSLAVRCNGICRRLGAQRPSVPFHSTSRQPGSQDSHGNNGGASGSGDNGLVRERPRSAHTKGDDGMSKISMTEFDKPDFVDLVDLIMSGKSYKEVVAGTEFDDMDPEVEEEMEEARRRLNAFRDNSLEEYLLSKGDALDEKGRRLLKSIQSPRIEESKAAEKAEDKFQIPRTVKMAQGDWSELLVHTDRVQKVVKGGMEVSYRALVVVGNLHGAGGFAIGKASNPGDAIVEASRKAKLPKNLVYVERYKQACLFQDVLGKHNGCKAYIWARPPGYGMRGSALMRQVLYNIGITDAGIKIVGNRNKYSMIYAVFDGLAKHRGLEATAKARGKRILTIHRAREQWS